MACRAAVGLVCQMIDEDVVGRVGGVDGVQFVVRFSHKADAKTQEVRADAHVAQTVNSGHCGNWR